MRWHEGRAVGIDVLTCDLKRNKVESREERHVMKQGLACRTLVAAVARCKMPVF
jgi:hypothetical protein